MTKSLIELIGNTPLLRLDEASEVSGCEIYGKAEFLNPGQSVKDRAALQIVRNAIDSGELKKGATIVEGTAGNTGIGLALVGAYFGFKVVIVIPDTQSQEKKDQIRLLGAHLIEVPAVPYKDPNNYVRYSERLAIELKKSEMSEVLLNNLFQQTQMRTSFSINMVALIDGKPGTVDLKRILVAFIEHRREIVTRRTIFELKKAREKAHILEGLGIALLNVDEIEFEII